MGKIIEKFSNLITGTPLTNEQASGEKYNVPCRSLVRCPLESYFAQFHLQFF
jgi:hypothetical protein